MPERLPVPPPPGSDAPPARPEVERTPDDDDLEGDDWVDPLDDEDDAALLDPTAWPDDLDEPTVPEGLLDSVTDLDDLPDLAVGDDDADDEALPLLEDVPLEDDFTDLEAPDDLDLPVLPWSLEVLVDGVGTPARLDPGAERSCWRAPGATAGRAHVVLTVSGVVIRLEVVTQQGDESAITLGRDVLAGRFLLRP